jgi:hypothetical protein
MLAGRANGHFRNEGVMSNGRVGKVHVGRRVRGMVAMGVFAWLSACGGGGGGSSSDNGGTVPKSLSASLAGVASKGLLKQAVVKAYALLDDGALGALLAQGRTTADGHYSLSGLPAGALVLVEISADAQTLMADEASGKDIAPAPGFRLRAAATLSSGGGQDVLQVTPFSEMAVAMAEANGGLKADVLATSNARVKSYASYDVLTEEPKFDSSNRPSNGAALNLAALSQLASQHTLSECQAVSGAAAVACVVTEMGKKGVQDVALATQITAARSQVSYAGLDTPPSLSPQTTPFVTEAAKTAVAEAKALVKNVRSNGESGTAEALQQRFDAVGQEFSRVGLVIDTSLQDTLDAVGNVVQRMERKLQPFASQFDVGSVSCMVYSDANATVLATSAANAAGVECLVYQWNEYVQGSSVQPSDGLYTYKLKVYQMALRFTRGDVAHRYVMNSRLIRQDVTSYYQMAKWQTDPATGQLVNVSEYEYREVVDSATDLTRSYQALVNVTASASGNTITQASFAGELAPTSNWNKPAVAGDRRTVDLSASVVAEGTLTRLNVAGVFKGVAGGQVLPTVSLEKDSHLLVRTATPGDLATALGDDQAGTAAHFKLVATGTSGSVLTAQLDTTLVALNQAQGRGRGQLTLAGNLRDAGGALLFDGKVTLQAPTDVVQAPGQPTQLGSATLELDGTLPVPDRPQLQVHLASSLDPAVDRVVSGTYVQGTDTFLVKANVAGRTGALQSLKLSTPGGISATYAPGVASFNILKGADVIGVANVKSGRVDYVDNTWEQY